MAVFKKHKISDVLNWQAQKEIDPLIVNNISIEGEYSYPFYGQATKNNGIISYLTLTDEVLNNKSSKPTILIHSNNQNIVFLQTPFYLKDGHGATSVLQSDKLNEKNAIFIRDYLKKNPENEGVHYSDIFENYIYTVKDKPRRSLADWLPDYFFKTDTGTWRLPSSKEEENLKAEGRAKGINRRIKRYVTFIEQGVIIHKIERVNETTLAEWIRHCKRSGLYDQGKLLYEKGGLNLDNLPEDIMVNVEEDYQVCVRMITRGK